MAGEAGSVDRPPSHYDKGISPFWVIDTIGLGFYTGNAIKYLLRFRFKNSPIEDLKKAIHYLEEAVIRLERGETDV